LSVKLCLWDLLQIFSGLAKKAIKYSSGFGHQVPNNITLFGFHVFMRTVSNDSHRKIYTIIITIAVVFIILSHFCGECGNRVLHSEKFKKVRAFNCLFFCLSFLHTTESNSLN
jgi:hypothetical protein